MFATGTEQSGPAALDHRLESSTITAIADATLGPDRHCGGQARIAAILEAAESGDHRTELVVSAFGAIADDLSQVPGSDPQRRLDVYTDLAERANVVEATRAAAVAEARRLYWLAVADPAQADFAALALQRLIADHSGEVSAVERIWAVHGLSRVLASSGRYAAALKVGVVAAEVAKNTGTGMIQSDVAVTLSYVFLSVDDLEAALAVVEAGLVAAERCAWHQPGLYYNAALTYALTGRFDQALALIESAPWHVQPERNWGGLIPALTGFVYAQGGHLDAARTHVMTPHPPHSDAWTNPNRTWLEGHTLVALGEAEAAVELLDGFLDGPHGASLKPLDGAQIQAALSSAREQTGDHVGALHALRASQSFGFDWVGDSAVDRLRVIDIDLDPELGGGGAGFDALSVPSEHYVAQVTHDMRNSLQGVMAMIALLQTTGLDDEQHEFADSADAAAQDLLVLCNDVLDLARMEAGRLEIHPDEIAVRDVVLELVEPIKAYCRVMSGVRVSTSIDRSVPWRIRVDPLRFKQVVLNTLVGAVNATRGSVDIDIGWVDEGDRTGLDVVVTELRACGGDGRCVAARRRGPGGHGADGAAEDFDLPSVGVVESIRTPRDPAAVMTRSGLGPTVTRQLIELMGGSMDIAAARAGGRTVRMFIPADG